MRKVLVLILILAVGISLYGMVNFASTQLHPASEREFIVSKLAEFTKETGIKVNFLPLSYTEILSRVEAEQKTGKISIGLVADLQGGLYLLASKGFLQDLSDVKFSGRTFIPTLEKYAFADGKKIFIPWLQATYVMVVNKKAFDYLPAGLSKDDVINGTEKWTYEKLYEWAKKIYEETGQPSLGFPMGPKGLWHRFLHGYIYPSFTGAQAIKFDSVRAVEMWNYLKKLFKYIHPASSTWDQMSEPLLRGEVLIAWDHTARIKDAIVQKPDDFVVVPVPAGPMGRGYIIVLAGLAVPNGANTEESLKLADFLTSPSVQVEILKKVGFFPVVKEAIGVIPEGALKVLAKGVVNQSSTKDSVVAFIPNLGPKGGEFTETYRLAFRRIVMNGEDPEKVVKELGEKIRKMFKETKSTLPEPDASLY
ncbi:MAG: carbohydrate ABC transporter substrate-binding protein [Thermotoga sp.]|nr:MAG: carbohydrate ABC transporter substrate-binding protein [Thermotoga sp.]